MGEAVIASGAKQSIFFNRHSGARSEPGISNFRFDAAHRPGMTMNMFSHPRGMFRPSCANSFRPEQKEGAGNAGAYAAPAVSYARKWKVARTSIQVQRKHSGIPCAMV
jgi:hypothetical protein